jgi:hypothetical protein
LATLTAEGLETVTTAARNGDLVAARRVLAASRSRRAARAEAELAVRRQLTQTPPRPRAFRQSAAELQLVCELGRIGHLVDALARSVVEGYTPPPVLAALAPQLETLGTAGGRRLRHLDHLAAPAMDADYLRAGTRLRGSLELLERGRPSGAARTRAATSVATTCSGLIRAVLSAGSLAARVC